MSTNTTLHDRVDDIRGVRIGLASPADIHGWSCGEVTRADTLNYRTGRPVNGGLFCERIFGPEKDWECACGKYRGMKYKGLACERCGVRIAHSRVRRKRLGHVELVAPVVHSWFFKTTPSVLAHLLDLPMKTLEKVIYFQDHVVVDAGSTPLVVGETMDDLNLRKARAQHGDAFEVAMGGEAIARLVGQLDLVRLAKELRVEARTLAAAGAGAERQKKLLRRLAIVQNLLKSANRPEWMVLTCLPVVPPDLRPIVLLPSGNYASSDLNELYRRVIHRNARLKKLVDMGAPEIIVRNEKRLLQQAVDGLFDNGRLKQPIRGANKRPLKSLGDLLRGKQGRFRENLLGKRVDFSARSVIVAGPDLKLHQCGLPKTIALELYQPFVIGRLLEADDAMTVRKARELIRRRDNRLWDVLAEVVADHPVLLNRAPTLHRLGIQAFEPVLIEGNAIRLHPLVCKGFNADFDGDQMAVHLPLSIEAQAEARVLLAPAANIFSPANGKPMLTPSQDVVLGCYYLTVARGPAGEAGDGMTFHSPAEVIAAHEQDRLGVHARIRVRMPHGTTIVGEAGDQPATTLVTTTVGRVLFNDVLPEALPFYDVAMTAGQLGRVIADCHRYCGRKATVELLDRVKALGFREATRSGVSIALADLKAPRTKAAILRTCDRAVEKVRQHHAKGNLSDGERSTKVVELWAEAREKIGRELMAELRDDHRDGVPYLNPVYLMARSGARGSEEQLRQLAGMRGLMARPNGEILETPIRSSFREGLTVLEYFSSTHGARKGLTDTALKTSDSGYLTRKLVDSAQDVVVTMLDCGTTQGVEKSALRQGDTVERRLAEAIIGRVSRETVRANGSLVVRENELVTEDVAAGIERAGKVELSVRSPLTCRAERGVCQLCYGADRSTGRLVEEGAAVGVIAAQSIGEPATQLTLRTFHVGGVAHATDITTGLPRVIELFEARRPDGAAVLAEVDGVVRFGGPDKRRRGWTVIHVQPVDPAGNPMGEAQATRVALLKLRVADGERVRAGMPLSDGPVLPQDVLHILGPDACRDYLLHELQKVYRAQRIEVDDKHLEIVIARMLSRVKVRSAGDTDLLPGAVVDRCAFDTANGRLPGCMRVRKCGDASFVRGQLVPREVFEEVSARLRMEGKQAPTFTAPRPATCAPLLLGVTRAALHSPSFLSAASFQETTSVLAGAALAGATDELRGLKENVLLGRRIPAGTGYRAKVHAQKESVN